ncbi:hypothetical protein JT06_16820, partial [Desulfobulbus sp. Tol-SR]
TLSNKEMQEYLETIKSGPETLWSKFVSSIRTLLGLPVSSNTALAKVLAASEQIFDAPVNELLTAAKTGTPATVAQTTAMNVEDAASKIQNLPAFKKWFAGSKVVDADGAPLVVYHGTTSSFDEFKSNYRKNEQFGFGIHLTDDPEFASRYADKDLQGRKKGAGNVIPAYVSAKNILNADEIVVEGSPEYALAYKLAGRLRPQLFANQYTENGSEKTGKKEVYLQHAIDAAQGKTAEKAIREAGYDGVWYESKVVGTPFAGRQTMAAKARSLVVFEPTQIKSIFNQTWDGSNPDIAAYQGSVESQMISSLNTAVKDARTTAANALASLGNPKDALHDKWLQHAPKVLAVTPLSHLAQTYGKTIPWIKDLAKHTNELEATTTRLIDDFFA